MILFLLLAPAAAAQEDDGGSCLTADPPPPGEVQPLRFGITPRLAGSAGAAQEEPAPEDLTKNIEALTALRPKHRALILRLNRLFWSDGDEGDPADGPARPPLRARRLPQRDPGPLPPARRPRGRHRRVRAVRRDGGAAARPAARRRRLLDHERGEPPDLAEHLRRRLRRRRRCARPRRDRRAARAQKARPPAARRRLQRDVALEPRHRPRSSGRRSAHIRTSRASGRAVDNVGVQVYPGLVWPPAPLPGRTAGDEIAEALTLVRDCYMPKAGLGREVELWVSENGYATNLGHSEDSQAARSRVQRRGRRAVVRRARDHRLPLVQPARQQLGRHRPVLSRRPAARRLLAKARLRRLPPGDQDVRQETARWRV